MLLKVYMATIVNTTPAAPSDSGSSASFLIGSILLLVLAFLFFYYGLPAIRSASAPAQQGTSIQVPDQIDVNVNGGGGTPEAPPAQ